LENNIRNNIEYIKMANDEQKDILNKIFAQPELAKHIVKMATILQQPGKEFAYSLIKDDPEALKANVKKDLSIAGTTKLLEK
jgi:hypothetical protein